MTNAKKAASAADSSFSLGANAGPSGELNRKHRGRPPLSFQAQVNASAKNLQRLLTRENPALSEQLKAEWPEYSQMMTLISQLPLYIKLAQARLDINSAARG